MPQWLALEVLPPLSLSIIATTIGIGYIIFEAWFFCHYHWQLVPRANRISCRPPAPYRDYPSIVERRVLLSRILDRLIERNGKAGDKSVTAEFVYKSLGSWFRKKYEDAPYEKFSEEFDLATLDVGLCPPSPAIIRMAWSQVFNYVQKYTGDGSNKSSSDSLLAAYGEPSVRSNVGWTGKQLYPPKHPSLGHPQSKEGRIQKENMDEFLSWAFFGVPLSTAQSNPPMKHALKDFYIILETKAGLTFEPGYNPNFSPRLFAFENVRSLYRPCAVYISVALMCMAANCVLYLFGFRRYFCDQGLRYWHRPAKQCHHQEGSPFLFFHGIAPGGYALYLPMIFAGILRGQLFHRHRDIFLFENKPVSYAFCFDALSEEDTIHGVLEAIEQHLDGEYTAKKLTICGHSLGSCQLTWMIKSPLLRDRIRLLILLDPVSILLSEPDVVVNFLYARREIQDEYNGNADSFAGKLIRLFNETKIHLVASSEMFIEHYLRRNLAWYNSELWLEDIPREVKVIVGLAENDEIANTSKIEKELTLHNSKVLDEVCNRARSPPTDADVGPGGAFVEKITWRAVGHAHCVMDPGCWSDIHLAMVRSESQDMEENLIRKTR